MLLIVPMRRVTEAGPVADCDCCAVAGNAKLNGKMLKKIGAQSREIGTDAFVNFIHFIYSTSEKDAGRTIYKVLPARILKRTR